VVTLLAVGAAIMLRSAPVEKTDDALAGRTREAIERRYGKPDQEVPGIFMWGDAVPLSLPAGPSRTLIFKRRAGGTLIAWLEQSNGQWKCYSSYWLADAPDE
jgi:hypothetical protein